MEDLRERAKFYEGKYAGQIKVVQYISSRRVFVIQETGEQVPSDQGLYMMLGATNTRVLLNNGNTYIQEFYPDEGWGYPIIVTGIPHEWANKPFN